MATIASRPRRDKTESGAYVQEYVSHFLEAEPSPGIDHERKLVQALLPGITAAEVTAAGKALVGGSSRVILATSPKKDGLTVPTEAELRGTVTSAEKVEVTPWNDAAATAASWEALPMLPAPLEDAMRRRAGLAPADGTDTAPDVDNLLMLIETAWDLPTPPAFESARRERKLLAMKESLESRRSIAPEALAPVAALALLLSRDGLNAGQRGRLAAVLAAWRRRGP